MTEPAILISDIERGQEIPLAQPATLARRMLSGMTQLMIANGIVKLVAILTIPILTRLLDPQAYGIATLLATTGSLASVIALGGVDISYTRAYHSTEGPNGAAVENFTWRFALCSATLLALLAALGWRLYASEQYARNMSLTFVLFLAIIFLVVNAMALARARLKGRYRAMSLSIVATGCISAIAGVSIAFFWRRDALALLIPTLLSYAFPVLTLGMPRWGALVKSSRLKRHEGIAVFRIGLAAVVTAPMYWLLSSSDRWFLQYFKGTDIVGIYSIAYSVAVVGGMVNNAVMTVWLAEAAREFETNSDTAPQSLGRLMSRLIAAMAVVWLVADAAGGDIVRWVADYRFRSAAQWVPLIAAGVFFYGVAQLAAYGLVLVKQFKWAAVWWFVGGAVCVGLNLLLVPRYGATGAAITQAISFAAIALAIFVTSQVNYPMQLAWRALTLTGFVCVSAGVLLAPPWHNDPVLSLLLKAPVGILVSIAIGWITAPDWTGRALDQVHEYLGRRIGSARRA